MVIKDLDSGIWIHSLYLKECKRFIKNNSSRLQNGEERHDQCGHNLWAYPTVAAL